MSETTGEKPAEPKGTNIPPKLDLRKTGVLRGHVFAEAGATAGTVPAVGAAAQTKPPTPVGPVPVRPVSTPGFGVRPTAPSALGAGSQPAPGADARTPTLKAKPVVKMDTARISLDAAPQPVAAVQGAPTVPAPDAAPTPAAPAGGKTIRIRPVGPVEAPRPDMPTSAKVEPPAADAGDREKSLAEKRKTSRIPLEAAVSGVEGGPKTIRLKRPGDPATVRIVPGAAVGGRPGVGTPGGPSKTSKLPEVAGAAAEAGSDSVTRRKTIRVKRAGETAAPKVVSVARPETPGGRSEPEGAPSESVSGFDVAVGVAAVLVACLCIYVFAAQAFGRNYCMTRLSYGLPEMDLPWPGKLR